MTRDEFWKALKKRSKKHGFRIGASGDLREWTTGNCPLAAVAEMLSGAEMLCGSPFDDNNVEAAARNLRMRVRSANEIGMAADNNIGDLGERLQRLRRKLLEVVGKG